jgi:hypothetical protein
MLQHEAENLLFLIVVEIQHKKTEFKKAITS